jgi:TPR repeat protein
MRRPAAIAFLIISLLMAVPAVAGSIEDAKKAYDGGDYRKAIRIYKPLAEQGDAEAQYALGYMYRNGEGVPKDYVKAYMWFTLAIARLPRLDTAGRSLAESNRTLVATMMTPVQIAKAQKLAKKWKAKKKR